MSLIRWISRSIMLTYWEYGWPGAMVSLSKRNVFLMPEGVVDFVRHAGGHLAQSGQFLHLHPPLFLLLAQRRVDEHDDGADDFATFPDWRADILDGKAGPSLRQNT